jgi:hypothetical protein
VPEGVDEPGDPSPVGPKRIEQLEHLLIRSARPAGEVIDDHVLEVEISDIDLIGVSMGS